MKYGRKSTLGEGENVQRQGWVGCVSGEYLYHTLRFSKDLHTLSLICSAQQLGEEDNTEITCLLPWGAERLKDRHNGD